MPKVERKRGKLPKNNEKPKKIGVYSVGKTTISADGRLERWRVSRWNFKSLSIASCNPTTIASTYSGSMFAPVVRMLPSANRAISIKPTGVAVSGVALKRA
jgi:hypothetical protein